MSRHRPQYSVGTPLLFKEEEEKKKKISWSNASVKAIVTFAEEKKEEDSDVVSYEITVEGRRPSNTDVVVSEADLEWMVLAKTYKDQAMAKDFGTELGGIFNGVVVDVFRSLAPENDDSMILFHVKYSDGDTEDLELHELDHAIQLYNQKQNQKKSSLNKKRKIAGYKTTGLSSTSSLASENDEDGSKTGSRVAIQQHRKSRKTEQTSTLSRDDTGRRQRSSVQSYKELDSSASDDDESVEIKPRAKKKPKRAASRARKETPTNDAKDDESSEAFAGASSSSSSEDEGGFDDDDDSLVKGTTKATGSTKRKKSTATRKSKTTTTASTPQEGGGVLKKKTMSDSFEPINRPLYPTLSLKEIKEQKQYLDPCGQEATDDIISMLVGEQVDKVSQLLQRSLLGSNNNYHLGSEQMPLKLGTACSGTDAPALALTLVQEQLELRGLTKLQYEHKFSCEVEPFKQAYLARNFDSVLYPDICNLTDEIPKDAYGQAQPIPEYNLFVAGTSCKNFSMLRANKRLDIEDKGCSGETFLAAIEHMLDKQPPFCIFENVLNAPW